MKFLSKTGYKICSTYKLFSTWCNNCSWMRIGLNGLDVHEVFSDSHA